MLAQANGVVVPAAVETQIVAWTADGSQYFVGFLAEGAAWPHEYRLYVGATRVYTYQQAGPGSAYLADRAYRVPVGTVVSPKVLQSTGADATFSGSILGGI